MVMKREHTSRVKSSASNLALHGWRKNVALLTQETRSMSILRILASVRAPYIGLRRFIGISVNCLAYNYRKLMPQGLGCFHNDLVTLVSVHTCILVEQCSGKDACSHSCLHLGVVNCLGNMTRKVNRGWFAYNQSVQRRTWTVVVTDH